MINIYRIFVEIYIMEELYLYIEDMKERAENPGIYSDILQFEREMMEISMMEELKNEIKSNN